MTNIRDLVQSIKTDRIHGASELANHTLEVLSEVTLAIQAEEPQHIVEVIRMVAEDIQQARPTMAPVSYCTKLYLQLMEQVACESKSVLELKNQVARLVNLIQDEMATKKSMVIEKAAVIAAESQVVLTCSYSSTVMQALVTARNFNNTLKALVVESVYEGISYGQIMAQRLSEASVKCVLIPDNAIVKGLKEAKLILLGADSIMPDGSVINGYPSLLTAELAKQAIPPVPVLVIGESIKKCAEKLTDIEDGFELVPSDLITRIITDQG
ncbi:MAG: hypothetical protein ACM3MK_06285 [Chitinophagales bacterium]